MIQRMYEVLRDQRRPFCYTDFRVYRIGNKQYVMAHGTFRNKVSELIRKGIVYVVYYSRLAFYSLAGFDFLVKEKVTRDHMVVPQPVTDVTENVGADKLLLYVSTLDSNADSIHDIHTKFTIPGIYNLVSRSLTYSRIINSKSRDIKLEKISTDNVRLCITIHRTDTVTVSVACSRFPVILSEDGLGRLSGALEIARRRLIALTQECGLYTNGIPVCMSWLVTLWHLGKDKYQNEYPAKGYAVTWGRGCEVLRCYMKNKYIHRAERQESPNVSLSDALKDKMGAIAK